jgi:purine catabolism regulator
MTNFASLAVEKYQEQLLSLCQGLRHQLSQKFERTISIGFGRHYLELKGISTGYKEASAALQLGGTIHGNDFCCHFNDLRFYRILIQFHDKEELRTIYNETIGKLSDHDKEHQTNLTDTLRTFFDCNTSLVETAQKLFVHVNTIKYRLQKVEQITCCNINRSEERLWLQTGLKIQSVLFGPQRLVSD